MHWIKRMPTDRNVIIQITSDSRQAHKAMLQACQQSRLATFRIARVTGYGAIEALRIATNRPKLEDQTK